MRKISPDELLAFDDLVGDFPIKVDLVYSKKNHIDNLFKAEIYKPSAKLWGHKSLVDITLRASEICYKNTGLLFEIKDCLRPVEAQAKMMKTEIVKNNPHWIQEPSRMLSSPGKGGHPRGMAVDVILITENGDEIDMGTNFDYLSEDPNHNPSARSYRDFTPNKEKNLEIFNNRKILENAMLAAAAEKKVEVLPLSVEWWDFRFKAEHTNLFEPINDKDLPKDMQMMKY